MNVPYEQISVALLAQLKTATYVFQTASRAPKPVENVPASAQPALFLYMPAENRSEPQLYGAAKYILHYNAWIYFRRQAIPGSTPETLFNTIINSVESSLVSVPPYERQRLGGLVEHAWIEGDIFRVGGIIDEQCVIEIPIKVLTAN